MVPKNEKAQVPSFCSLLGQVGEASSLGGALILSSRRNLCYMKSSKRISSVSDTWYLKVGRDMFLKPWHMRMDIPRKHF